MRLLEEMSQVDIESLDAKLAVVVIPLSPLERHGPHLPIGTDIFLSQHMASDMGARIEERWPEHQALLHPCIPIGSRAVPGPGSVSIRQSVLHDLLFDVIRGLSAHGLRRFVICSVHGSVGHLVAAEEVAERALRELNVRVEPAISSVIVDFLTGKYIPEIEASLTRRLTPEERAAAQRDVHGGLWETGGMLEIRPDLVDDIRNDLPPIWFSNFLTLRATMQESCNQGFGYVGSPACASADYSHAATSVLQQKVMERIERLLKSRRFRPSHTLFYYLPAYRTRRLVDHRSMRRRTGAAFAVGAVLGMGAILTAVFAAATLNDTDSVREKDAAAT